MEEIKRLEVVYMRWKWQTRQKIMIEIVMGH